MNDRQRALNLLGLAMRAGQLITGEQMVLDAVKTKKAKLVVMALDASDNTRKLFENKTGFYNLPLTATFSKEELSHAIGKNRTTVAITDRGFAKRFNEIIENI